MHLRSFLPLVFASIVLSARGQFYAPDTEYHDPSQRTFPVEAARVLAWLRAANGQPPMAEVTYEVSISPARETVWKIRWLDAAKKPLREKEVRYAETQLGAGPDYYRGVFKQLEGEDWKIAPVSPDNAATTFWQGAELSGATRLDAVKAASTLLHEKPKMARAADAARIAGILSHATLPRFNCQMSVDTVLLSRAAAWLCIAESRSRETFDASWVSILFLSGREKTAADLSAKALWRPAEKQSAAERFWRKLASRPSAKDMFLFAGRAENKALAMPMLSYSASLNASLATTAAEIAGGFLRGATLEHMSEYFPTAWKRDTTKAMTGAAVEMASFLGRWEQTLNEFEPAELDYSGYRESVAKALSAKAANETPIASLQRLGPLLNLGIDQGTEPLLPTAHVTSRDLLGFGWEMACALSAGYHDVLSQPAGNSESAKSFASAFLGTIKGANIFIGDTDAKVAAPIDAPARMQHVGSARVQQELLKKLPPGWAATPDMPLKRQWLSRTATREAVAHMIDAKATDAALKEILERLIRESGPAIANCLSLKEPTPKVADAIDRVGLREAITREAPVLEEIDLETLKVEIKSIASESAPPAAAEVIEKLDFTKFKTAEEFWAALEKLREMPRRSANSPEDRMRQIRAWLESQRTGAEAFLKAYPNDSHRHAAKLMAIDASLQLARFGDKDIAKVGNDDLEAIINAPDADETTKGEAEFFKLMVDSQQVEFSSPHTVPPFQQALAAYLEKYPKHNRAPYVASMLTQILSQFETPSTEPLLKKLAKNANEQVAAQAQSILQQRQFMLELKKKPLELKFTATDGTEVDTTKLRGKVVLLDFWASWCGPCMAEAPHVVATYNKLRERGFEIIGISLDQDKAAMESALKSAGMTWPQHFDGKAWQTDIAQRFGVRAIPSTWLFDKQGKLREHDLRGQELEARIENLLKEK
jgi:thiol-disulfide isomerase/thioredoxin